MTADGATEATSVAPDSVIAGKYRIVSELGRGGMGTVYLGVHEALKQEVAIKILAGSTDQHRVRFLREAQSAARIQSEHVVRVMDVGVDPIAGPYMVMERLVGEDLEHLLAARGRLPVDVVVDAVTEAIVAVAEAHKLGIVHRDLKPANLFLTARPGHPGVIKVLDFGISKITTLDGAAQKLTDTKALLGSPHYMSPEQLRTAPDIDARTDTWSMGVVIHELIAGTLPFFGETLGAIFANILEKPPPPLRRLVPTVPAEVEEAVTRCLQRDPRDRYQHIGELALAIAPFGTSRAQVAAERIRTLLAATPEWKPSSRATLDSTARAIDPTTARSGSRQRVHFAVVMTAAVACGVGGLITMLAVRHTPTPAATAATLPPPAPSLLASAVPALSAAAPPAASASAVEVVASASAAPPGPSAERNRSSVHPRSKPHVGAPPSSATAAPQPLDFDRRR